MAARRAGDAAAWCFAVLTCTRRPWDWTSAAFGVCLVVAGLLLAASIPGPIVYIVGVLRFFSGFGD